MNFALEIAATAVEETTRLRAALAEAERERKSIRDTCVALDKHNDELEAENERLRAALAEAERERDRFIEHGKELVRDLAEAEASAGGAVP